MILLGGDHQEWWSQARCAQRDVDPDVFLRRAGGYSYGAARVLCRSCPVQSQCLSDLLNTPLQEGHEDWMFRAGLTPEEIGRLRRQTARRKSA